MTKNVELEGCQTLAEEFGPDACTCCMRAQVAPGSVYCDACTAGMEEDRQEDAYAALRRYHDDVNRWARSAGWTFNVCQMSGTCSFTRGDFDVCATPYWEDANGIAVQVVTHEGELVDASLCTVPFYNAPGCKDAALVGNYKRTMEPVLANLHAQYSKAGA